MNPAISILTPAASNPELPQRDHAFGAEPGGISRPFESFAAGFQSAAQKTDLPSRPADESPAAAEAGKSENAEGVTDAHEPTGGRRPVRRPGTKSGEDEPELLPWANATVMISQPTPRSEPRPTGTATEPPPIEDLAAAVTSAGDATGDSLLSLSAQDTLVDAPVAPLPSQITGIAANFGNTSSLRALNGRRAELGAKSDETASLPVDSPIADAESEIGKLRLGRDWSAFRDEPEVTVLRQQVAPTQNLRAAGISAAQQASDMKDQPQREEIAGSPALSASARQGMAGIVPLGSRKAGPEFKADPIREKESSAALFQIGGESSAAHGLGHDSAETLPALEPARDLAPVIQEQAIHLRRAGLESMEVVLKPDRGTELHLQLTQHAGQIEVHIRCDRGDLNTLGNGWAKLQESLAQQGIRLAPLEGGAMLSGGGQSGRQQGSPHQPQAGLDWLIPAPVIPPVSRSLSANSLNAAPRRPVAGPQRVLESWA